MHLTDSQQQQWLCERIGRLVGRQMEQMDFESIGRRIIAAASRAVEAAASEAEPQRSGSAAEGRG